MSLFKGNRWGVGIILLYGGFVLFILGIVAFASFQHFDLVEDHYYDKEVVYQKHIDEVNRTNALPERPRCDVDGAARELVLSFPTFVPHDHVAGTLILYRPSGASMDMTVPVRLDADNRQTISIAALPAGFWKAKLEWQVDSSGYFLEQSFFLNN